MGIAAFGDEVEVECEVEVPEVFDEEGVDALLGLVVADVVGVVAELAGVETDGVDPVAEVVEAGVAEVLAPEDEAELAFKQAVSVLV